MTLQIPEFLRIHAGDDHPGETNFSSDQRDTFWREFARSTGWQVARSESQASQAAQASLTTQGPELVTAVSGSMMDPDSPDALPSVSKSDAQRLAKAAWDVFDRLEQCEAALREQMALTASREARYVEHETSRPLVERVESILNDAIGATGFDAAGLYLLDDETSELNLRASVGLPASRLADPPRPLRGALGDLEAFVSTVVSIEDIARMPHWASPEARGAAIVVAVRSGDLPLGTLWLWRDQPSSVTSAQEAAAKLAAGQLLAELQRETVQVATEATCELQLDLNDALAWQQSLLPLIAPLDRNWDVSGWSESTASLSGGWYTWDVLPDGQLAVALSFGEHHGTEAALIAATTRSAWQAHCGYRHKPNQLLSRVNDTLWQTSTSTHNSNLCYANINPESGKGFLASAGNIHAFVVNKYGFRTLSTISEALGSVPDLHCASQPIHLLPGDTLALVNDNTICPQSNASDGRIGQQQLTEIIRNEIENGPEAAMAALRRSFANAGNRYLDRSLVLLHRKQ